ncbi:MAG: nuclear transport factor 2 family protein [Streptosporangiaceae bacterium]
MSEVRSAETREIMDELEIRNSLARIARYSDEGGLDDYADLFTEDARWEMPGVPVKTGRAEIRAAGAVRRAEGTTGPGSHTRHLVGTTVVTVAGDRAVAESTWQFYADTAGLPVLRSMGGYRDTFQRTGHGWLLAERLITSG